MTDDRGSWRVEFLLPHGACMAEFDAALEPLGGAVAASEIDGGPCWRVVAHCADEPDRPALAARLAIAAASAGIDPPAVSIEPVPETDWVSDYQRATPPVTAGGFFIYPSHYAGETPEGLIGIRLDAGLAFGTGEHASTLGCLKALETLKKEGVEPVSVLDMGCGSAILAIAMARLWPGAAVIGVDNDPAAVRTASDNVRDNGCAGAVRIVQGDGYGADGVADGAPYDIVVANILARPLIAMAPDAAARIAPGGSLILSGLLSDQAEAVLVAHRAAGFMPAGRQLIDNWATLILTTPAE